MKRKLLKEAAERKARENSGVFAKLRYGCIGIAVFMWEKAKLLASWFGFLFKKIWGIITGIYRYLFEFVRGDPFEVIVNSLIVLLLIASVLMVGVLIFSSDKDYLVISDARCWKLREQKPTFSDARVRFQVQGYELSLSDFETVEVVGGDWSSAIKTLEISIEETSCQEVEPVSKQTDRSSE